MTTLSNDIRPVASEDIRQQLQGLPNWAYDDETNEIVRQYRFEDGASCDRFVSSVEQLAAEVGYQPSITREDTAVEIRLGADEVRYRDVEFAHLIRSLDERNA